MQTVALFAYALATGLTLAGLAGTMIELVSGRRLGFRPPLVTSQRFAVSLALTLAAGPFMLGNEALAAWRDKMIDPFVLGLCALAAGIWSLASRILKLQHALAGSSLLGS